MTEASSYRNSLFPKAGLCALAVGLIVAGTQPSLAGPHGGSGGGLGVGAAASTQSNLNANGVGAVDRDTGLDRAQDRMSAEGAANNNAVDQETGAARAQTRTSDEGLANSKASSDTDTAVASNVTPKHRKHKTE